MNTLFKLIIATVSLGGFLFGFDMAVISGTIPLIRDSFQLTPVQEGFLCPLHWLAVLSVCFSPVRGVIALVVSPPC